MGEHNYLRHHGSLTSKNMNSMQGRFANRPNKTRIMSVRRTDTRPTSMMPKTAINFYNLRKGLYLKNGAQSVSRQASTGVMNTYKSGPTKSTGLLNAYGELAAADLDIGGGIATQSNLFHHRGGKKQRKSNSLLHSPSPLMPSHSLPPRSPAPLHPPDTRNARQRRVRLTPNPSPLAL